MKHSNPYNKIFIIGAPRSGTNILRDILSLNPEISTWDCDELNEIWHYKSNYIYDDFTNKSISIDRKKFIKKFFDRFQNKSKTQYVLEKTCANSMRVRFIQSIFPEAIFIVITRNGEDVIPSASKRWDSTFSFSYSFKKFKVLPLQLMPTVFFKHLIKWFSPNRKGKMNVWGPKYPGVEDDVKKNIDLDLISFRQWEKCINSTISDVRHISQSNKILKLQYENLVKNPIEIISDLLNELNLKITDNQINFIKKNVHQKSIGKNFNKFSKQIKIINQNINSFVNE
jgi:hypothetical protein